MDTGRQSGNLETTESWQDKIMGAGSNHGWTQINTDGAGGLNWLKKLNELNAEQPSSVKFARAAQILRCSSIGRQSGNQRER